MSAIKEAMMMFNVWCIEQHRKTNHFYDKILPYEYHLRMVVKEVRTHLDIGKTAETDIKTFYPNNILGLSLITSADILESAAWGHDIIEDTRNTYNDVLKAGGSYAVADIIYAVTDEKGKNRAERGSEEHYKKLVQVPGAAFVKFCDRIANVKYSKFAESSMYEKYRKEHEDFIRKCYIPELENYGLLQTMNSLFDINDNY